MDGFNISEAPPGVQRATTESQTYVMKSGIHDQGLDISEELANYDGSRTPPAEVRSVQSLVLICWNRVLGDVCSREMLDKACRTTTCNGTIFRHGAACLAAQYSSFGYLEILDKI
jgi:hypothetical protein